MGKVAGEGGSDGISQCTCLQDHSLKGYEREVVVGRTSLSYTTATGRCCLSQGG
jgi:hypothetical protein